jgi:hypothetical protein
LIDPKHIRVGNLILTSKEENQEPFLRSVIKEIRKDHVIVDGERSVLFKDCAPLPLTVELLKGCGFEITDFGDFWECKKDDFVLFQPRIELIPGLQMPFVFAIKSSIEGSVTFTETHHLQNTFLDLKQQELKWKS